MKSSYCQYYWSILKNVSFSFGIQPEKTDTRLWVHYILLSVTAVWRHEGCGEERMTNVLRRRRAKTSSSRRSGHRAHLYRRHHQLSTHRTNNRGKYFLADIKKIYLGHHAGEETTIKCLVMSSNLELGRSKTPLFVNIQARSLYAVLFIHSRHATTSL